MNVFVVFTLILLANVWWCVFCLSMLHMKYQTEVDSPHSNTSQTGMCAMLKVDPDRHRFPFCLVWTPIPLISWFFPFIGHMGIATSSGVIRDFAGPYFVSEDKMGFGWPTKYWQMQPHLARGGDTGWDRAVAEASDVYMTRMHNLFCDNCHSHVAMALNLMHYNDSDSWNMVKLAFYFLVYGKYISFGAWLKTWLPFLLIASAVILVSVFLR